MTHMKYNFCTLFDQNYLYRGIALHSSIVKNCSKFRLWILCMDEKTFEVLQKLNLKNTELVQLYEIEDDGLLDVKSTRNAGEYSWTCKPYLMEYILKNYNPDSIAYLDSDLYFFKSPEAIFEELKNCSIMLTPHRFSKKKKNWEKTRGKYNAGVIIMKNDEISKKCLEWWRLECLKWCFQRYEDDKLGDQMYLNQWRERFGNVYDISNEGFNLGPWSLIDRKIENQRGEIIVDVNSLVLFHFHALKIFSIDSFDSAFGYIIPRKVIGLIYEPYYIELQKAIMAVKSVDEKFNFGFSEKLSYYKRLKNLIAIIIS